jgi:Holliday junction resolvase RusA-like endonuclease
MEIIIPFKTPSINHLYGQHGWHKYLTKEGRELRSKIIGLVERNVDLVNKKLKVDVTIYENWEYKTGEVARKDVNNREKFLIDSVFEGLGLDDKMIYVHSMSKMQSETEEKAVIVIGVLDGI